MKRSLLFLCAAMLLLNGCVLAPFIESFKRVGVTPGDRQQLLAKEMKHFNDALYWGNPQEALSYLDPESGPALTESLRKSKKEERIVDSKVEGVDFSDSSFAAVATVNVRYYRVPYFMVKDRVEVQTWRFSMTNGWKLIRRELQG